MKDFGTYHEVVCYFEKDNDAALDYAYQIESRCPEKWDSMALEEMRLTGLWTMIETDHD
jgi:hypothetical protein